MIFINTYLQQPPRIQGKQCSISESNLIGAASVIDGRCILLKAQIKAMKTTLELPMMESCIQRNSVLGVRKGKSFFPKGISITCSQRQHYRQIIAKARAQYLFMGLIITKTYLPCMGETYGYVQEVYPQVKVEERMNSYWVHSFHTFINGLLHAKWSTKW